MGFLDGLEEKVFSCAKNVLKRRREITLSIANRYYPFILLKHRIQTWSRKYLGHWPPNPQTLRITLEAPDILSQNLNLCSQRLLNEPADQARSGSHLVPNLIYAILSP